MSRGDWPELPYEAWRPTRDTLHMYLQIIGKVRLALAPMEPQGRRCRSTSPLAG